MAEKLVHESSCPFPVGFGGYFATDPNAIYPGTTWTQKKDVFILAAGDTYSAGSTGGEATHTLTINEMPSHEHNQRIYWNNSKNNKGTVVAGSTPVSADPDYSGNMAIDYNEKKSYGLTGGGAAHNNMPPYLAVYVYKRIA